MALVPEPRADKNGKMVTRHVRSGTNADSPARSAPAPEVFSETSQELARRLGLAVSDIGRRSVNASLAEVMQLARRVPSDTAQTLLEARAYAIVSRSFDYCLATALQANAGVEYLENFALLYSDDQYCDMFDDFGSDVTHKVIKGNIAGLQHYPELGGVTNFYRADEETRKKAIALTAIIEVAENHDGVTTIAESDGSQTTFLTDQRLVQLTIENAGNLRRFLNLARERGCNVDALVEGMKTTAPLRDGAL